MFSFVLREMNGGVLIGLEKLVDRIPCQSVTHWRFRSISITAVNPFGMPLRDFQIKSSSSLEGVTVSNDAFWAFLCTDFQVLDGIIEGLSGANAEVCLFRLDCFDTSQWEATTEDEGIAKEFEKCGWVRQ